MAITRAQLLKELLPGLNALFGLEYESTKTSMLRSTKRRTQSVALKRKSNYRALAQRQLSLKVRLSASIPRKSRTLLVTTTKRLQWAFL